MSAVELHEKGPTPVLTRRTFIASSLAPLATALLPSAGHAQLVNKYAEQLQNGEFNWFPERSAAGPVIVIVSIPDQRVHVYRNGIRIAASSCSTVSHRFRWSSSEKYSPGMLPG